MADRVIEPTATVADRLGMSPNAVSLLALVVAGAAGIAFYLGGRVTGWFAVGAVLVFLNGSLDLVDGALARRQDVASSQGDLIDHVFDRYADILIVGGIAAGVEQYALGFLAVTGVLMTSYLGTQAIAVGMDRVYGGLLGRADRLALIAVITASMVIVPDPVAGLTLVGWLLLVLAVVGHATAFQRFVLATRALS